MASSRPSTSTSTAGMGRNNNSTGSGHAVDRSSEFLACARSALQMGQDKHRRLVQRQAENGGAVPISSSDEDDGCPNLPEELLSMAPAKLHLYSSAPAADNDIYATAVPSMDEDAPLTTDALRLLSALDSNTTTLSSLVRRRGHTNDPTARINETVGQFDEMAKELVEMVEQIKAEGTLPIDYGNAGSGRKRMSRQRARHYEYVAKDLSAMADARVTRFKQMLEVREKVIRDQNERRRMLNPTTAAGMSTKRQGAGSAAPGASSSSSSSSAPNSGSIAATITAKSTLMAGAKGGASQLSSPLFTVGGAGVAGASAVRPPPPPPARPANGAHASASVAAPRTQAAHNGLHQSSAPPSTASAGNGAYGTSGTYGAYGGGGYGGMGMRRRPNAPGMPPSSAMASNGYAGYGGQSYQYAQQQHPYNPAYGDDDSKKTDGDDAAAVQNSIQTRRARRETAARLEQARNAERTLANLGTMFSKMADLVVAQGETIEKVEDDVEAARVDIYAGHEEIQKLYGITKGNRGLILKVFGILIFFIIFMRFY